MPVDSNEEAAKCHVSAAARGAKIDRTTEARGGFFELLQDMNGKRLGMEDLLAACPFGPDAENGLTCHRIVLANGVHGHRDATGFEDDDVAGLERHSGTPSHGKQTMNEIGQIPVIARALDNQNAYSASVEIG